MIISIRKPFKELFIRTETNLGALLAEHLPIWNQLSLYEQEVAVDATTLYSFKKGEHVHSAGFDCIGVLFAISGTLRAYMLSENGREITLFHINGDDCCVLSASCIMPLITFDIYLDALTDTVLLAIAPASFSDLMENNPHVDSFAYRQTAERFSEVMWVLHQVLFVSFDKRLAAFLVEESSQTGSTRLSMTHDQIARYIGSAREVVTRMLQYFQQEGFVRLSRGLITITDPSGLRRISQP